MSSQLKVLGERVSRELHKAMNPIDPDEENDSTVLTDAIRDATLVNGCGATVDTGPAKELLETWQKQKRWSRQLATAIENVQKCSDDRTVSALKEMLASAVPILGESSAVVQEAEEAISVLHAVIELEAAFRTCRVAHDQSCMMHPRVDKIEEDVPEYGPPYGESAFSANTQTRSLFVQVHSDFSCRARCGRRQWKGTGRKNPRNEGRNHCVGGGGFSDSRPSGERCSR